MVYSYLLQQEIEITAHAVKFLPQYITYLQHILDQQDFKETLRISNPTGYKYYLQLQQYTLQQAII